MIKNIIIFIILIVAKLTLFGGFYSKYRCSKDNFYFKDSYKAIAFLIRIKYTI